MEHINKLIEASNFTEVEKGFIKNVRKEEVVSALAQQQVIVALLQAKATNSLSSEIRHSVSNLITNNSFNSDKVNMSLKNMDESARSLAQGIDRLQERMCDFSNETTNLTKKANKILIWYVGATITIAILTAVNIYVQIIS